MIKVSDPIYGTVELPQVFEDLLNTEALNRLKKIHHSGAIFLVNPEICHSRLEHSIGVMLLIRFVGGSELEQIAGLLHDLSHTVFSHVGDYIFDNKEENYHEQLFEAVLEDSGIPEILYRHGYEANQLLQGSFSILEQPLPGLCADRLDYTLRDAMHARLISRASARSFLNEITLQEGLIVVKSKESAGWIDQVFKRINQEIYNEPLYVYANQELALLIRRFIDSGQIRESELMKDDTFMLNKIRSIPQGFEGIRAIKQQKGFARFLKKGPSLQIKHRQLRAMVKD
jgi:HD superfamily phosphohydrolase